MLDQPLALAQAERALRHACARDARASVNCDAVPYRRVDGRCNNVRDPLLGAQVDDEKRGEAEA